MTTPSLLVPSDHLLFLVLAVLVPVRAGVFGMRRLRRAAPGDLPTLKLRFYQRAMIVQWSLVALAAALWLLTRRPWSSLGLVPRVNGGLVGVGLGVVIIAFLLVRQGRLAPGDEEALAQVRSRTSHLERLLPHTRRERSWFFALSATAGVCEEILYRGYVIWYLVAWAWLFDPAHAFLIAAGLSSIVFGVGHLYQGPRGAALTALVGAFLAAIYWITRSLFAGMVLHALLDVHAGYLSHLAWSRDAAPEPEPEPTE
jgi:uncharacterized protein